MDREEPKLLCEEIQEIHDKVSIKFFGHPRIIRHKNWKQKPPPEDKAMDEFVKALEVEYKIIPALCGAYGRIMP